MLNFLFFLLIIFFTGFACLHIMAILMGGAALAFAGTAWALLTATICLICIGILAVFLFAGLWIFILCGFISFWIIACLIFFPVFLPVLLPLLIVYLVMSYYKNKRQKLSKPEIHLPPTS